MERDEVGRRVGAGSPRVLHVRLRRLGFVLWVLGSHGRAASLKGQLRPVGEVIVTKWLNGSGLLGAQR